MMSCSEVRLAIGAEPHVTTAELEDHLRTCAACSQYRVEMRALDADLARAMQLPVTASVSGLTPKRPRVGIWPARPALALAASVLLAAGLGLALFVGRSGDALAKQVVTHVLEEPMDWAHMQPLSRSAVTYALRKTGVELDSPTGQVVYAQACWFGEHVVPHLIVRTPRGEATVLLLADERVWKQRRFEQDGLRGILLPARQGAIAVLAQSDEVDLKAVATLVDISVHRVSSAPQ